MLLFACKQKKFFNNNPRTILRLFFINLLTKMVAGQKRKKWSKGKSKEKSNNSVLIDKEAYEKILKEVFKNKLSTPSVLCERFHITASLAKKILTNLCEKNVIKHHENLNRHAIYTKK